VAMLFTSKPFAFPLTTEINSPQNSSASYRG
jgi:hypothetical protein